MMTPLLTIAATTAALLGMASPDSEPASTPEQLETASREPSDSTTEVIDLEKDRARRFTIPVMVDGTGPYNFMIDTGSQATAVTHGITAALNLPASGSATLVAMASRRPVELVEVATLTFGSQRVEDLISPVLDRGDVGADGIIGLDSLQDLRVLIDFRDETIAIQNIAEIKKPKRGFEIIVRANHKLGQLLVTDARVEGIRATVIIDTGAQGSIGNLALRDRIRAKRAEQVTTTDVNGVELVGDVAFLRSLAIEDLELAGVPLIFADTPSFEALGLGDRPAIKLGMNHLRLFDRVAIDFAERQILFDVPREVARMLRHSRRTSRIF